MAHEFKLPYLLQYDNKLFPGGTCNVTSLGMGFEFYGVAVPGEYHRVSDNLTQYCLDHGYDRHSPYDLARVAELLGIKDDFRPNANWKDIKGHLDSDNPVIIHGDFTKSGHIVILHGYDETKGFLVNDPAGVYPYHDYRNGDDVWYGSDFMREKGHQDGDVWAHFLNKKTA